MKVAHVYQPDVGWSVALVFEPGRKYIKTIPVARPLRVLRVAIREARVFIKEDLDYVPRKALGKFRRIAREWGASDAVKELLK